ncbi:Molybdopterin molybdenumtransferase [hydrothermal vent metagenome]|uniref:molybdopterin molybdotransferase n=1 Tax=hydrothermal vent metagenome TaxID=652676 RepID=A0A3B0S8R5_9ZZZZ
MKNQSVQLLKTQPDDCCGGDNLLPIDVAVAKGLALAKPVEGFETVSLSALQGRSLINDIHAGFPLPNFNNSAMDGYAVNTENLNDKGPYRLEVTGRMAAGDRDITAGGTVVDSALRILTGALVPPQYDAVIMQENVQVKDNHIVFDNRPKVGTNIRLAGEDCKKGDLVVASGTLLDARHIAMLAAQGIAETSVRRKVRVAIFSTGSELRLPGEVLQTGQIYNSNRYALASQLNQPFIEVFDLGTIRDDFELLKSTTAKAAEMADIIITTGGVSVGDEDHMPKIVTDLGGQLHVMKVAIKPGKPVTVGTIGKTIFLGLPGNPVAAFINQILIGREIIDKLADNAPRAITSYPCQAQFSRQRSSARQEYVPAKVVGKTPAGIPIVKAFKKASSATLLPLVSSDGFVVLPVGLSKVRQGDVLQFIPH